MKITETGASNAPPPTRGGAKEQRAGSSFDQLLALHDQARTAAAEGPKSKSERRDHGVRAHGDPQRAHDARDARRAAHDERKAASGDAKPATPAASTAPAAEAAAPEAAAPEASAAAGQAVVAPVVAEPVAAPVATPVATPVVATATATTAGEDEAEGEQPQQAAVPALPVAAVAAEGEDTAAVAVPLASAAVADPAAEQAPAGTPAPVPAGATNAPETTKTVAPEAPGQAAVKRAPVAADVQPDSEQATASAEGERPATTAAATTAPVATGRETATPVANNRAREVAAPNAAVHDTAPAPPVEGAPAPGTSPAAALRGPQHAPGLQLAATVERLRDLVQVASRNGAAHARLQLHPAEFGGIEVRLRSGAAGVTAKITADRPEAVQALQQAAVELRQSLQERGLTVLDVEVSLASADGSTARDAAAQAGGSQSDLDSQKTSDRRGTDAAPDTNDLDEPDLGDAPRGDAGAVLVDVLA